RAYAAHGGSFTNLAGGSIYGSAGGVVVSSGAVSVTNQGTIVAHGNNGVFLLAGGTVTNQSALASIYGITTGVYITGGAGTLANSGAISSAGKGVYLKFGGAVGNRYGGVIGGGTDGVDASAGTGAVINAGVIRGNATYGIHLSSGGTVVNQSSGTIEGGFRGIAGVGFVAIDNAGIVSGGSGNRVGNYGIGLSAGSVVNRVGGTISGAGGGLFVNGQAGTVDNAGIVAAGSGYGIALSTGGTVTNAGTIIGGTKGAVYFGGGFTNRLIVDPGAVVAGAVNGGNAVTATAVSTLELAAGTGAGVISGLGTQFVNFAQIALDAGATWTLGGSNSEVAGTTLTNAGVLDVTNGTLADAGTIVNNGVLNVTAGTVTAASLNGTGQAVIGAGGTLDVTGTVAATQAIFLGAGGVLQVGSNVTNDGVIAGAGVQLAAGGTVTNQSALATITGSGDGVFVDLGAGTVTNAGAISGVSTDGVHLNAGGVVSNLGGGSISGKLTGVYVLGSGTVTNAGVISSVTDGVILGAGGAVSNLGGGSISAGGVGVGVYGSGIVTNAGVISGNFDGVFLKRGGTVANAGTIAAAQYAMNVVSGYAARLIVDPGAVFVGAVNGGNAIGSTIVSTLELAAGAMAGQLSGLGTQFVNFAQIALDAGASWTLGGSNSEVANTTLTNAGVLDVTNGTLADAGTIVNDGVLNVTVGTVTVASLNGTGQAVIGVGGTLDVTGTVAATEAIVLGAGGMLQIGSVVTNAGTMSGASEGVFLAAGGTVGNRSGGVISGGFYGIQARGGVGDVTNQGSITGQQKSGVVAATGTIANLAGGAIAGGNNGIFVTGAGTVTNAGAISGTSVDGIFVAGGGTIGNLSGGAIAGGAVGVALVGGAASVINAGVITGTSGDGIAESSSAVAGASYAVSNLAGGTISGGQYGIVVASVAGTITNAGTISGAVHDGVALDAGGVVSNLAGGAIVGGNGVYVRGLGTVTNAGVISGAFDGVYLEGGGTVTNAGTIGSSTAVFFKSGLAGRLIVDPGAVFVGAVDGGNTIGSTIVSTLELAAGAAAGQITGLGGQFTHFAQITLDAGATWTLGGSNSEAAGTTLTNAGVLDVTNGALVDAGSVVNTDLIALSAASVTIGTLAGTGEVLIGGASTLALTGSVAAGQTVDFAGTGLLTLLPGSFAGEIAGLGGGGRIALSGVTDAISASLVNANTLAIAQSAGPTIDLTLDPSQSYAGVTFVVGTSGGVNTVLAAQQVGPTVIGAGTTLGLSGVTASLLAASGGGTGGITVTGAGADLTTTGSFVVGDTSLGNLAIQSGGSAVSTAGATIGNTSGASGSAASVTGAGSDWQVTGQLDVGNTGYGQVSVSAGGVASVGSLDAGAGVGGTGVVDVVGAGASLSVSGGLTVGDKGAGSLSILNGGQVSTSNITVGASSGAQGNLVIGAGSTLTATGAVDIGLASSGVLEIQGGTLHTTNAITKGSFGHVIQIGGVIDPLDQDITGFQFGGGGVLEVGATITNSGNSLLTIPSVSQGSETFLAPLMTHGTAATGIIDVSQGGTLILDVNTVDTSQTVLFGDNTGELVIGQQITVGALDQTPTLVAQAALAGFAAKIDGYTTGNVIVVETTKAAGFAYVAGGTVIAVDDLVSGQPTGAQEGSLTFTTAAAAQQAFTDLGNATVSLQDQLIPCFAAGTRLAGAHGAVAVEDLRPGDLLRTASGALRPVRWIGQRAIDLARHPDPHRAQPIRVAADAFADGIPARDLLLSPDHAVFDRGRLIPIRLLVNGSTITRETGYRRITYYHVELDSHDLLLAEGLTAESYLDCGNRGIFANAGEPLILHPDFRDPAAQQAYRLAASCAQLADAADEVKPVWFRLADRAAALGMAPPEPSLTRDPALAVLAGGMRIAPVAREGDTYRFAVPAGRPLRLVSRAARPSDAEPWLEDQRQLGVMVRGLRLNGAKLALDCPSLGDGWWAAETDGASVWRWTDGDAALEATETASVLEVELGATQAYARAPSEGEAVRAAVA
ncbi:MAG: Hint domain-containing protein, partial [Rhodospirillales bacterium]|nr:Hint domain-containing protein [Rhodospirillales bacterium]